MRLVGVGQENAPRTHQSILESSRNTGICSRIIHELFKAMHTHPEENNIPIRLLLHSRLV